MTYEDNVFGKVMFDSDIIDDILDNADQILSDEDISELMGISDWSVCDNEFD